MSKISKSPERNTFQKNGYIERKAKEGKTPENDPDVKAMVDWYESWNEEEEKWAEQEHKNDLEYDLRTTDWILAKVRASDSYAQNLYAAICNNDFMKLDVVPILKEETCSYSWRYAGGIIADMRQEGDYIDWYCSGCGGLADYDTDQEEWAKRTGYVAESVVTDEIRADLKSLGWTVVETDDSID